MGLLKLSKKNMKKDGYTRAVALVRRLSEQAPIHFAYLFGSGARGEMTPDSDLDLLVVFDNCKILNERKKIFVSVVFLISQ